MSRFPLCTSGFLETISSTPYLLPSTPPSDLFPLGRGTAMACDILGTSDVSKASEQRSSSPQDLDFCLLKGSRGANEEVGGEAWGGPRRNSRHWGSRSANSSNPPTASHLGRWIRRVVFPVRFSLGRRPARPRRDRRISDALVSADL